MNTTETERSVDLRILFFRVLKRWRLLLLFLVLGLIAGAVFKYVRGGKVTETVTEEVPAVTEPMTDEEFRAAVEEYEIKKAECEAAVQTAQAALDAYQPYADGSIITKIDPYNVSYAYARIVVTATPLEPDSPNASTVLSNGIRYILYTLSSRLENGDLYDILSQMTGTESRFLREVISFSVSSSAGSLEVSVNHYDPDTAKQILDKVLEYVDRNKSGITAEGIDPASIRIEAFRGYSGSIVSSSLNTSKNNITKALTSLTDNVRAAEEALSALVYPNGEKVVKKATKETREISHSRAATRKELVKFALLFGIVLLFAGIIIIVLKLLFPYKILSAEDTAHGTRLPVYANYGSLTARHKTRFDKWILRHLEGKTFALDTDGHSGVVKVASEAALQGTDKLFLLSSSEDVAVDQIAESLQKTISGVKIEILKGVLSDPALFGELQEESAAILVEKLEKSLYSGIIKELEYVKNRGASVKGMIVYE